MSDELFEKILSDIQGFKTSLDSVGLFFMGEPFLFPRLFQWLQRLREENHTTVIFSNAALLDEEKAKQLAGFSDVVSIIVLSLCGYDDDSFNRVMGLDFKTIYANVQRWQEMNQGTIDTFVNCPRTQYTHDFIDDGRWGEVWQPLFATPIGPGPCYTFAGLNSDPFAVKEDARHVRYTCGRLFHVSIFWDGRVNLCCMDPEGTVIIGDVREKSVLDIYNGDVAKYYRQMHKQELFDIPLCRECNMNIILRERVKQIKGEV
jgi:hypothetical protein